MLLKRFAEEVVETPLEMLRYLEFIVSHKKSMESKLANLTTTPMDREKRCLISNEIRKTETKLASHLLFFEKYMSQKIYTCLMKLILVVQKMSVINNELHSTEFIYIHTYFYT